VHEVVFGEPLVAGDRAAVEYRAVFTAGGRRQEVRGVSVLRFDGDGLVAEHRDYWAIADV
jgi:hypothetical protein